MPMEMLRMIKRTFRDALGKLLNSKSNSKTHDNCSIHIGNKYIQEFRAKINKQSSKIKIDFKNDWCLLSCF